VKGGQRETRKGKIIICRKEMGPDQKKKSLKLVREIRVGAGKKRNLKKQANTLCNFRYNGGSWGNKDRLAINLAFFRRKTTRDDQHPKKKSNKTGAAPAERFGEWRREGLGNIHGHISTQRRTQWKRSGS